jgi:hypothetical protein
MNTNTIESPDPMVHAENIYRMLQDLIAHVRGDVNQVEEPRFRALLETTAEVLTGLETAFSHYREGTEKAWKA